MYRLSLRYNRHIFNAKSVKKRRPKRSLRRKSKIQTEKAYTIFVKENPTQEKKQKKSVKSQTINTKLMYKNHKMLDELDYLV